jgi:hypothetical protein
MSDGPGVMSAMGPCLACGQLFMFDPELVPSLPWPQPDGPNQPICKSCITLANTERPARGLPPIVPLPGAYLEDL